MKKGMTLIFSAFLLAASAFGIAACDDKKTDTVSDDIVNGGFEQGVGDLTGWTKTGSAFSQYGVVNTDKVGNVVVGKVGNNFFSGYEAGNPQFTGTLTSDTFKLGGTGKIGFLLGAGKNGDKCYVEFYEEGNDTPLLKITNTAFNAPYVTDHLIRNIADLSEYVGKNIYIKVTDNDKGDAEEYSYVNLDDFKVYQTEAEVEAAQKERDDKLAEIGAPEFSEDPTETTIKNGDFEDGMNNWLVLEGNTFGPSVIGDASELFWNTRSFNAEGEKFLNGYKDDESFTGAVRSTKFTLAGDGIISLLWAVRDRMTFTSPSATAKRTKNSLSFPPRSTLKIPNFPKICCASTSTRARTSEKSCTSRSSTGRLLPSAPSRWTPSASA